MSIPEALPPQDEVVELEPQEFETNAGIDWALSVRKAGAAAALAGAAFFGGFVAGDMLPTQVELGPHNATVQLTPNDRATLDLGPIGSANAPSPLHIGPLHAGGVKIVVKEIPDGDGAPLGPNEVRQYEQFFSAPGRHAMVTTIEDALLRRGIEAGLIAAGGVLLAGWVLRSSGREAVAEALKSRRMLAVVGAGLASAVLASSTPAPAVTPRPENAVLAALGVHDINVDGKALETAVNKYGPAAIDYVHKLDAYYGGIQHSLQTAYDTKRTQEKNDPQNVATKMLNDGAAESVLWISDNHCNTETAGIAADMAKRMHAVFVMDTGDQTMGGTSAERLCVSILPQRLGSKIPVVVSLGNHDSRGVTATTDEELGYVVLQGKVVGLKGYTILGDSDVMRNSFGESYHQEGPVTPADLSAQLAETARQAGGVDLLMIHEPQEADATVAGAWAKFAASGHTHVESGPVTAISADSTRYTYRMVNGTTGGAAPNKMTFESQLGKDATMIELVFSKQTKEPLGYRNIIMHPNGTVEVGDVTPFEKPSLKPASQGGQPSGPTPSPTPSRY